MPTMPGFTALASLPAPPQSFGGRPSLRLSGVAPAGDPVPFEVPPEWVAEHADDITRELEEALEEVWKKYGGGRRPPASGGGGGPRPGRRPPRSPRTSGRVHTGVLSKLVGTALLAGCELECALTYNACLVSAGGAFDGDIDQCDRIRDMELALARKGRIAKSVSDIFRDANACVDAAESRFDNAAAICATRYAICSLGCLVPFSFF